MPTWAILLTVFGSISSLLLISFLTMWGIIMLCCVREDRSAWGILLLFISLNIIGLIIGIIIMQKKYNELLIELGVKKNRKMLYDYDQRKKVKEKSELKNNQNNISPQSN